jgi:hypothetical protein
VIANQSRDYHNGTGSRVFLTENPVCYKYGTNRWCTPSNAKGLYNICGPLGLLHHNGSNPSEPTSGSNPVDSRAYFQQSPTFTRVSYGVLTTDLEGTLFKVKAAVSRA